MQGQEPKTASSGRIQTNATTRDRFAWNAFQMMSDLSTVKRTNPARHFRVIYDFTTMNLVSGDSLRGSRDLKALWEAHVIYCILVLRENDVSTNAAPDYGSTHGASGPS